MECTTFTNSASHSSEHGRGKDDDLSLWHTVVCIIMIIIGTFGIIGNILTFTVLVKIQLWTSVNVLIGIMSISDLLVIPFVVSVTLQSYLVQRLHTFEVPSFFRQAFMTSSIICAVVIGCERSYAVRNPLKYRQKWSTKVTVKIYVLCYILFLSLIITRLIICELVSEEYFESTLYLPFFIIVRGLPFVVIFVTNVLLVRGIKRSKNVSVMTHHHFERERIKMETSITITVMAVTIVYFICMVPGRIFVGLYQAGIFHDYNRISYYFTTTIEILNFSINCVAYTVTSKFLGGEYTKLFRTCFSCLKRKTPDPLSVELQSSGVFIV